MFAVSVLCKAYYQQYDFLVLRGGVVYRSMEPIHGGEVNYQLLLPRALREEFLTMIHTGVAGHLGAFKTRAHVGRRVYWFQWRRDVDVYCRNCVRCNEYCRGRAAPKQGRLHPMTMGAPSERWACDLSGPFPVSTKGHVYILTCVDVFTKFIVLVPLRDKHATTVARAIMHHVFLRYGAGEILTDNGLEFKNDLLTELCRLMGVARCFTTSYQPRTNAVCERSHATINFMLTKCVDQNHRDWDEHLPQVAFCYNASAHESTQFSPFFLMHVMEPRWDVDLRMEGEDRPAYCTNTYADLLLTRLENAHTITRDNLQVTAS